MSARVGEWMGNKLYIRCPECGDSNNHSHAHMALDFTRGTAHCFRCGYHRDLSLSELAEYDGYAISDQRPKFEDQLEGLRPHLAEVKGPVGVSGRFTLVQRKFTLKRADKVPAEIFESRDQHGKVIGFHGRISGKSKKSRTWGKRAFGYYGTSLTGRTIIRVVEGPYDVRYEEDVCTFGMPSSSHARALGLTPLILCPDGDVWTDREKFLAFFRPFMDSNVLMIEQLPDGLDPDEVPDNERAQIPWTIFLPVVTRLLRGQRQIGSNGWSH